MLDGISAQAMRRSGDSEAAGALRRVTGVNVEGGKYVYVRGLSDRYSKTTLNGVDIPGLDTERNTVQMDLFPTNLIDNLVVYKTFIMTVSGKYLHSILTTKRVQVAKGNNLNFCQIEIFVIKTAETLLN